MICNTFIMRQLQLLNWKNTHLPNDRCKRFKCFCVHLLCVSRVSKALVLCLPATVCTCERSQSLKCPRVLLWKKRERERGQLLQWIVIIWRGEHIPEKKERRNEERWRRRISLSIWSLCLIQRPPFTYNHTFSTFTCTIRTSFPREMIDELVFTFLLSSSHFHTSLYSALLQILSLYVSVSLTRLCRWPHASAETHKKWVQSNDMTLLPPLSLCELHISFILIYIIHPPPSLCLSHEMLPLRLSLCTVI